MAITASGFYMLSLEKFFQIDAALTSMSSTSCKYMLDLDADVPDFSVDDFRDDTSEHAATGNYTAGGNAIVLVGDNFSIAADVLTLDFADPQWTASTITAMGGIFCSGNATNTLDEIYLLQDFVSNVVTSSGTLDVAIHANGVATFT